MPAENDSIDTLTRAVQDVTAFPLLTEDFGAAVSRTAGSQAGRPAPLDALVKGTLRDILSWRPKATDDGQGFAAALAQSFSCKEVDGRTVCVHVPRSYVMQVQSDGGAVTGAQASIYARAQAAVRDSLPLLEGLYPLSPDSDREDLAAVTATVRLGLTELVDELGRSGGPRPQRVDSLFELLLGLEISAHRATRFHATEVGGQLGLLRDRLGFENERVNTAEEEKNLTNFLILADYVFTLWLSWKSLRTYFDRTGPQVFLGPQLVLLSRAFAVIAESVQEAYAILDSVFIGPAERETIRLNFPGKGQAPLTLAELLEWAGRFAAEEAPQHMVQAGKDGVIAFRPTLQRLVELFEEAVNIAGGKSTNPPPGGHTVRVVNALTSIKLQLDSAEKLTRPLSRTPHPDIDAIDPVEVETGAPFILRIEGKSFHPKSRVRLDLAGSCEHPLEAQRVHFGSASTLWATFDNDPALVRGSQWTVGVINPDGAETFLRRALTVAATDDGGYAQSSAAPKSKRT